MMWWMLVPVAMALAPLAWLYPRGKQQALAAWHGGRFRALGRRLGACVRTHGDAVGAPAELGFLPTVVSVFGPFGDVRNVLEHTIEPGSGEADRGEAGASETVYLFEYRFGHRPSRWAYRRSVVVAAFHVARPLPVLTLRRARGEAKSRTTEHRVGGQPLVVEALDDTFELWTPRNERRRARALVTPPLLEALHAQPSWDIRARDRWLVMFDETARPARRLASLDAYLQTAIALRAALGDRRG